LQIAAVAVLLVTVVAVYNTSSKMEDTLAVNDTKQTLPVEEKTVFESETMVTETPEALEDEAPVQPVTSSSKNEVTDLMEAPVDMAPAEASAYYREMSVAEEIKNAEQDDEIPAVLDLDNVSTGAGTTRVDQSENLSSTVSKKTEDSKSEVSKSKDGDKNLKDESKRDSNSKITTTVSSNAPAGTTYSTAEKENVESKEGTGYVTGSAGGVFGDTADSAATDGAKPDVEEESKKFNINETKILKKLVFVVK
jgi:hypothetical protein